MEKTECSIVLCGAAGQGIQTVEDILTRVFKESGYHVFATKEYMSRVRGGLNSTQIRVGEKRVNALTKRSDIVFALDNGALAHLGDRIQKETLIFADSSIFQQMEGAIEVGISKVATELGSAIYANTIAAGFIAGLFKIEGEIWKSTISKRFDKKGEDIVSSNLLAFERGISLSKGIALEKEISFDLGFSDTKNDLLLNGSQAVALGALAGGVDFIASYPMSPSTGVLAFLAKVGKAMDVLVEQAEDEIAAINMCVGAWYAGARAMVTTSGGGFALMCEGVSLAGVMESPAVIHIAQRPGPGTGLPTRTEQADLELALYAGHGEFPRAIFAPGTIEDAFHLSAHAFEIADRFQVPAFILTDQYLVDSYYNVSDLPDFEIAKNEIVRTEKDYERYGIVAGGVSQRGIPGYGDGLVFADSDEHTTKGLITESADVRVKMMDKRLSKKKQLDDLALEPIIESDGEMRHLIICWGSPYTAASHAIKKLGMDGVALCYLRQVWPLPKSLKKTCEAAKKVIVLEGNATGQLSKLLKLEGIHVDDMILRYDGAQFNVEDLEISLLEVLK